MELIITASTALIVLTPTRVVDNTFHTNTTTALDVAMFLDPKTDADTGNYNAAMLYYGALETRLPLRLGSSLNAAYQQVQVPEIDKPDYVLTQSVDAFYPTSHCKIPQLNVLTPLSNGGNFTIEMDVPPCPLVALADLASGNRSLTSTKLTINTMGNFTLGLTDYTHSDYYAFPCGTHHGHSNNYLTLAYAQSTGRPASSSYIRCIGKKRMNQREVAAISLARWKESQRSRAMRIFASRKQE